MPFCLGFVDYEKAFNSIVFTPLFKTKNQRISRAYITLLHELYNGASSTLKLHKDSDKIKLE